MKKVPYITICIALTICFSIPSLLRIPVMLPFTDIEVRQTAPLAVEKMHSQGIWLVNTELKSVEKLEQETCFTFEHKYRSKGSIYEPEIITTCI
ncbi:MAG: hypothetical protein K9M03_04940 [Kiritimatiellales bacterium]|nr:hypothetical protein [Kiritimatiellales bacterium]